MADNQTHTQDTTGVSPTLHERVPTNMHTTSRHTPLHETHEALGANFTDFGGWDMPLRYGSELAEHKAVREAAGVFDLSHMGEVRVTGPDSARYLNTALAGNLAAVAVGRAKYSLLLNADGGIIDDLIVYRLGETEFLVVPNASNTPAVVEALKERAIGFDVTVEDESYETALVAVQGPNAEKIVAAVTAEADRDAVVGLRFYSAARAAVAGAAALVARTGYTGEDGYEIYVANADAKAVWDAVAEAGQEHGLLPCGLAARDSLRLEAGMPLYGNELSATTSPLEAGLGPVVSLKKEERFEGRDAFEAAKESGLGSTSGRRLVGLKGLERRAARGGYTVMLDGAEVGQVTSGQPSPTLGYPVALAMVDVAHAEEGTELAVDIRGKMLGFTVVPLPFYRRSN